MSVKLKINSSDIITFDLNANDILTPYSGAPATAVSKLSVLTTQAELCTTIQCYNCNEVHCNEIQCTTTQCNSKQCTTVQCSNCKTVQCNYKPDTNCHCDDSRDD